MGQVLLTLLCPPGADEGPISHGDQAFTPYRGNDGSLLVDVPVEAAGPLLHNGGFTQFANPAPAGPLSGAMVRIDCIEGSRHGVGWLGVSYPPDAAGGIMVPAEAVNDLRSHGFQPADEIERERARRRQELDGKLETLLADRSALDLRSAAAGLAPPGRA